MERQRVGMRGRHQLDVYGRYWTGSERGDCASGQFANGFDADGDIQCAAPASSAGVQAYSAHVGEVILAGTTTVISKAIPA